MDITMSDQQVKVATESEKDAVIDTLKLAFGSDPATRWVWPDPQKYLLHFSAFAKAFGGRAFVNKTAYYIGNYSAAALWLSPNIEPDIDTMLGLLHTTTSEEAQNILPRVFEKMGSFHPTEPHWYLPLLGVDPLYYGKGLGSILMKYASKIFDKDNSLAYLESSNPKNIPFYQRHGFEQLGTIEVDEFPPLFPMLRKPQKLT
jgi:ribosomal protein S18 acetylase RimI-like enzyme